MSASKAIPGPYTLVEGRTLIHIESRAPEAMGQPVASVPKKFGATACLLSAAPRMRDALEAIANGMADDRAYRECARAALAESTGVFVP